MSVQDHNEAHRLTIRRGGRSFRGHWRLVEDVVEVTSVYGANIARTEHEAPRDLAETLLGELAFRWCAQHPDRRN